MKKHISLLILILCFNSFSQTENFFSSASNFQMDNKIRLNYTLVHMPVTKVNYNLNPTMGFIGMHYNIPINDWLYTGAAIHGAVTGDQGGFFTLGVNLGVNKQIYKNLYFDANVHFGGGGGYRTLVNGGGFLYPNIGLQYKKDNYSFGVQYGHVNFFTGLIRNDNFSFFIEIPSPLQRSKYSDSKKTFTINNTSKDKIWKKPAVKSVQQITFDFLFPTGNSRTDASTTPQYHPIENTLSLLGFEYQRYLTSNTFAYIHLDAMYSGLTSGFMDMFIGVGKNFIESKNISFFGKMGIGAAGGRIFPEGGLTLYPSIGVDVKLTDNFGISAHGGYHKSILGLASFEAYTAGFSLKYYGLSGGTSHPFTKKEVKEIKTQGIQLAVENQTYLDVAKFGIPKSNLQLIALKVYYDLNSRYYLTGEASFAYEGESGGYAHGIFGLGVRSNKFYNNQFSAFLEAQAGVAGGGRVDAGEGVLIRPTIGINYHLNNDFSFHLSAGQMISPFGDVNSTNFNIGFKYGISVLNSKK